MWTSNPHGVSFSTAYSIFLTRSGDSFEFACFDVTTDLSSYTVSLSPDKVSLSPLPKSVTFPGPGQNHIEIQSSDNRKCRIQFSKPRLILGDCSSAKSQQVTVYAIGKGRWTLHWASREEDVDKSGKRRANDFKTSARSCGGYWWEFTNLENFPGAPDARIFVESENEESVIEEEIIRPDTVVRSGESRGVAVRQKRGEIKSKIIPTP